MSASNKGFRKRGYPQADLDLAAKQREAEKRAGGPVRSLAEVLAGRPARARADADPIDLTTRQLRKRGRYGQAALLTDQQAAQERDPERAVTARVASGMLKGLAARPEQMEFDFFVANVSTGLEYHDAIRDRLTASAATPAERLAAGRILMEIIRWLAWQSYECQKTAGELADLLALKPSYMARMLQLLESVGAITRVRRGRTKTIVITPEGAYRGDITKHADAVDRYRAEVAPFKLPRVPVHSE